MSVNQDTFSNVCIIIVVSASVQYLDHSQTQHLLSLRQTPWSLLHEDGCDVINKRVCGHKADYES